MTKVKYISLSFIKLKEQRLLQIKSTILFNYIFKKYKKRVPLSNLLENTQYGFTASAQSEGNAYLIRITDIQENGINWEKVPKCICNELDKFILKKGDILVARTGGTTGKSYLVEDTNDHKSIFASYLIRLRHNDKVIPEYIHLFLNSYIYWNQIITLKSGSAQPNVNARKLSEIMIPICPILEQKKLIEQFHNNNMYYPDLEKNLSAIEKKINLKNSFENNNIKNQQLIQKLLQAILSEAVSGKLVPQDLNDEPASILLEKIKQEKKKLIKEKKIRKEKPLPKISENEIPYELPEGWVWVRLGDVVNYGSSNKLESKDIADDTWLLDLEDIEKTTSKLLTKKRFQEIPSKSTKNVFLKGDVLYGKLRPYLDKVILADEDGVCTTEIIPIKGYFHINSKYLRLYLKNPHFLKYVSKLTYGVKMPRLGTSDGKKALFPLAPFSEQKCIVEKVDRLMELCDELEKQVKENQKNSESLMNAVLREAFEA